MRQTLVSKMTYSTDVHIFISHACTSGIKPKTVVLSARVALPVELREQNIFSLYAVLSRTYPTLFSDCSLNQLSEFLNSPALSCLLDRPGPDSLYGGAVCGNGMVDTGEECDCGSVKVRPRRPDLSAPSCWWTRCQWCSTEPVCTLTLRLWSECNWGCWKGLGCVYSFAVGVADFQCFDSQSKKGSFICQCSNGNIKPKLRNNSGNQVSPVHQKISKENDSSIKDNNDP